MNYLLLTMLDNFKKYKFNLITFFFLAGIAYYSFSYFSLEGFFLALNNAILIQVILLMISRIRFLSILFIIVLSVVVATEVVSVSAYSSRLSFEVIASIFETNKTEASDMLKSIFQYIPLAIFLIISIILLSYLSQKEQLKPPIKKIFLCLVFAVASLALGLKSFFYIKTGRFDSSLAKSNFETNPLLSLGEHVFEWTPSFFCTSIYTISYIQERYMMYKCSHEKQIDPLDLYRDGVEPQNLPSTIFLVMGESSNRDHYSLYNYQTLTTPSLDSLASCNKLLYYKAVSPSSSTRESIPFIFTFSSPRNPKKHSLEKNIIALARDLGYESYWISSQDKIGLYDSPVSYVASVADFSDFPDRNNKEDRLDINLIKKVQDKFSPNKKQLFVLHLRGSHELYTSGYDSIDVKEIQSSHNMNDIDYDRTIHHTDRVLGSLVKYFFQEQEGDSISDRVLFYTSDHGEIVNEGHALITYNMDQFKVPFIVMGSTPSLNRIDSIVGRYMHNNLFNTVNFTYVFSEFMGYKVKEDAFLKAKDDELYFRRIDRKILKFSNNMN